LQCSGNCRYSQPFFSESDRAHRFEILDLSHRLFLVFLRWITIMVSDRCHQPINVASDPADFGTARIGFDPDRAMLDPTPQCVIFQRLTSGRTTDRSSP
jgi:hypothetical protein